MILADSSVVIDAVNDRSGLFMAELSLRFSSDLFAIAPPTRMEVLMGARGDEHWRILEEALRAWRLVEFPPDDWTEAARIYADLRRAGLTVQSPMDCCIAQAALSRRALLLHRDGDFDLVAQVRPALRLERISIPPKR